MTNYFSARADKKIDYEQEDHILINPFNYYRSNNSQSSQINPFLNCFQIFFTFIGA